MWYQILINFTEDSYYFCCIKRNQKLREIGGTGDLIELVMSKTMSQPWLKLGLLDYLAEGTLGRRNNARQKSKTVQVIQSNEEFKFLTINDKNNYFTVFLTSNCIDDMTEKEITFARLKHTLIKLNTYHFSTIVANIGSRDEKKFRSLGISYPLALQCDNLMYLGGDDSDTIGEPRDLNKDDDVAIVYTNLGYVIMAQRLAVKQFPTRGALPNYGETSALTSI